MEGIRAEDSDSNKVVPQKKEDKLKKRETYQTKRKTETTSLDMEERKTGRNAEREDLRKRRHVGKFEY